MKNFSYLALIIFISIGCSKEEPNESRDSINLALNDIESLVAKSNDCINSEIGKNLSLYYGVGTKVHEKKSEGYYCPLDDCDRYEEFYEVYFDLLSQEAESSLHLDYVPCESYFSQEIITDLFNRDLEAIHEFVNETLPLIENTDIVTSEEYDLIVLFFEEVFNDFYSIDYCKYISILSSIDTESTTNGSVSETLFLTPPTILKERRFLLANWYNGDELDDTEVLPLYGVYAVARFWVGFTWGMLEKGASDPQAGNCGLESGIKAAAFGI